MSLYVANVPEVRRRHTKTVRSDTHRRISTSLAQVVHSDGVAVAQIATRGRVFILSKPPCPLIADRGMWAAIAPAISHGHRGLGPGRRSRNGRNLRARLEDELPGLPCTRATTSLPTLRTNQGLWSGDETARREVTLYHVHKTDGSCTRGAPPRRQMPSPAIRRKILAVQMLLTWRQNLPLSEHASAATSPAVPFLQQYMANPIIDRDAQTFSVAGCQP